MIRVTRKELFASAAICIPGFIIGEWLAVVVGLKPHFSAHEIFDGLWGVLTFAIILAFTRGESA